MRQRKSRLPIACGPCPTHRNSNVLNMMLPENAIVLHRWIPGSMSNNDFVQSHVEMTFEAAAIIGAPVIECFNKVVMRQNGTEDADLYCVYVRDLSVAGITYKQLEQSAGRAA